ncbi:Elongation factor Tu GTP-binding domain-containing protein 1 [Dufourea novaeangliae]|uniref:Elongation factor Tu GTP-binding domain-containing protein 1 n=1 Tax=Dufourea novaeangliae TaxID=178035 RepID=A0A154PT87_DUFNO|nr:Elongation factor Tu GTP-binding domain-containing protein 1 [Dufourea novaeangliae]
MRLVSSEKLSNIQRNPASIRNICILAHVDHGKTTLADSLVASNGIISNKLAGKLRYLDSRPDEQLRGITMKSSSITLYHMYDRREFAINLIDSPGHVDFASEVSTAVRLCDGAIIVIDVVEGVCPQTRSALSTSYTEGLKGILVLNKIDRLITEMKLSPFDAYVHLTQVLEQVNAVMGELFASDVMAREGRTEVRRKEDVEGVSERSLTDWQSALENMDDSGLYFSPEQGNVLFSSATDGWGFGVKDFAKIFSAKLGFSEAVLLRTLWGDFYVNTKTKRIMKGAQEKAKKPLFVQLILDNIWTLYETITVRKDKEKIGSMAERLDIKLTTRDLRHTDPKVQLQAVCSQWLPLARACLDAICENVPAPNNLTSEKVERLLSGNCDFTMLPDETQRLKQVFLACDSSASSPVIVFVSKMFPVERRTLPEYKTKPLTPEELAQRKELARIRHAEKITKEQESTDEESGDRSQTDNTTELSGIGTRSTENEAAGGNLDTALIAFARGYSGSLRNGSTVFVLGPKHDPREALERRAAGEQLPTDESITLKDLKHALIDGLKLLNQADACAIVHIQETGEIVLSTAGEVHLERCLEDLRFRYAKVDVNVSEPIVPFKETVVPPPTVDMVNEAIEKKPEDVSLGTWTANRESYFEIDARPLPDNITKILEKHSDLIKNFYSHYDKFSSEKARPEDATVVETEAEAEAVAVDKKEETDLANLISAREQRALAFFENELSIAFREVGQTDALDKIWSFGPRNCGPNVFLNETDYRHKQFSESHTNSLDPRFPYETSMVSGFQLATLAGPLCEEPMMGVCFVLKKWEVYEDSQSENSSQSHGHMGGRLMSACKEACRRAFNTRHPRLVTPMYTCSVLVNSDVLGKLYAAFGKRQGRVIAAESAGFGRQFRVLATLPVPESFQLTRELRTQTSGLASPQLVFSHWEANPYWTPSTDEEYLHFGDKADSGNRAKKYIDAVRRRKGLAVDSQLVTHAEKQRTLSKKK